MTESASAGLLSSASRPGSGANQTPFDTSATPVAMADEAAGTAADRPAMADFGSQMRFWLLVVAGLALDLWSKEWAFHTLRQGGNRVLIPHVLEFHTTLNPGALFGIGAGHTEVFLVASVLALVLVLWMFAQSTPRQWLTHIALGAVLAGALGNMYDRVFVQLVKLRFQTAGGPVERFYVKAPTDDGERITLTEYPYQPGVDVRTLPRAAEADLGPVDGHVRDFIKIPTRWFGDRSLWPWVFNVADMLLVGGVAILALRLLRERKPHPPAASELDVAGGST